MPLPTVGPMVETEVDTFCRVTVKNGSGRAHYIFVDEVAAFTAWDCAGRPSGDKPYSSMFLMVPDDFDIHSAEGARWAYYLAIVQNTGIKMTMPWEVTA